MSDIETAVKASRQIEDLLEIQYHAKGRGLHEKLTSVEFRLPRQILRHARYIASVRNAVVHDDNETIRDHTRSKAARDEIVAFLTAPKPAAAKIVGPIKHSGDQTTSKPASRPIAINLRGLFATVAVMAGMVLLGFAILGILANTAQTQVPQNTTGPARPVDLPQIR